MCNININLVPMCEDAREEILKLLAKQSETVRQEVIEKKAELEDKMHPKDLGCIESAYVMVVAPFPEYDKNHFVDIIYVDDAWVELNDSLTIYGCDANGEDVLANSDTRLFIWL